MKTNVTNAKNGQNSSKPVSPKASPKKSSPIPTKHKPKKIVFLNAEIPKRKKGQLIDNTIVRKELLKKSSPKAITIKIDLDIIKKERKILSPKEKTKLNNTNVELENELNKLAHDESKIMSMIKASKKKMNSILRVITIRDNIIADKSTRLNKLKKDNANLELKLEQLNNKQRDANDFSLENMREGPIHSDEYLYDLFAPNGIEHDDGNEDEIENDADSYCNSYLDDDSDNDEEVDADVNDENKDENGEVAEAIPLPYDIIKKLPVASYINTTDETNKCILCDFDLCKNDTVIQIPSCLHILHKECLLQFFEKNNICPLCKEEVKNL